MKHFINTVSTTIKAFKLLSNPLVIERLSKELEVKKINEPSHIRLGVGDIYHHKHFMVQIVG